MQFSTMFLIVSLDDYNNDLTLKNIVEIAFIVANCKSPNLISGYRAERFVESFYRFKTKFHTHFDVRNTGQKSQNIFCQ